ncbi:MAG: asparagine--tRNA ligase [Desulfovibrio sp.]|nr:asparagine--tRNA ligase [Desulfovibrio sp.]
MDRTLIVDVKKALSPCDDVTICGWIRTRRDCRGFSFLEINDGSCLSNMQCLVDEGTAAHAALGQAQNGTSLKLRGSLVASPGKEQQWEIHAKEITIFGPADPLTYPLQKKRHSDEFLRSIAHLRPRTNKYGAIFRIRSQAAFAIHNFFHQEHFAYVHTPILTGSDCEGAGEMFHVTTQTQAAKTQDDFFSRPCQLTVSGQLEAEALACGLGRVYTFGPTFRAEDSRTPRHAAEFWMIEPEMAFADLGDIMRLAEDFLKSVISQVLETCAEDLILLDKFVSKGLLDRLTSWSSQTPYARLEYAQCIDILQKSGKKFVYPVDFGVDLQTEHERYLAEEYCACPLLITNYPRSIKPFYMRDNDDQRTVAAMDVLVPGIGEIIGGSQREERLEVLERKMQALGDTVGDYWWYLDLRRFGSVPHAGFGLGFERLLMLLTGTGNIRDVLPFPRTPGSLEF